jgi:carboxymethylenebutenolidase
MRAMLTAADGHRFDAHFALPKGKPRGGLVVVQEAFGVNAYVKAVCERFAAEGYACLAPALYDRQERNAAFDSHEGENLAKARKLRAGLVWADVLKDMAASVERLREFGRVGVVGYCAGGSVAWLAALELDISAVSSYYGRDVVDFLERKPRCPVILHFGAHDPLIPMKDVEKIKAGFPDAVHVYPAGHGFDREDSDAARLARRRTLEHFERHLALGA